MSKAPPLSSESCLARWSSRKVRSDTSTGAMPAWALTLAISELSRCIDSWASTSRISASLPSQTVSAAGPYQRCSMTVFIA